MNLKEIMSQKKLTQKKLSVMANIGRSDLCQALLGKRPMFPKWRKNIATALEMAEEELFPEYVKK